MNIKCISVGKGWGNISAKEYKGQRYAEGTVATEHGIVTVYCEYERPYTVLSMAYRGQWYTTSEPRSYSKTYLVTLAKRFAQEVARLTS